MYCDVCYVRMYIQTCIESWRSFGVTHLFTVIPSAILSSRTGWNAIRIWISIAFICATVPIFLQMPFVFKNRLLSCHCLHASYRL